MSERSYHGATSVFSEWRKFMFYLTTHSTHFIYSYMASDIWVRTILIVRKETCCCHIGYSLRLTARVLLYAPSHSQWMKIHKQNNTNYLEAVGWSPQRDCWESYSGGSSGGDHSKAEERKEGNVLFNNTLNTFYFKKKGFTYSNEPEVFHLTMHSTYFIYGYTASDIIW